MTVSRQATATDTTDRADVESHERHWPALKAFSGHQQDSGLRAWLAGNAGTQMIGWFRKPITSVDDLAGLPGMRLQQRIALRNAGSRSCVSLITPTFMKDELTGLQYTRARVPGESAGRLSGS